MSVKKFVAGYFVLSFVFFLVLSVLKGIDGPVGNLVFSPLLGPYLCMLDMTVLWWVYILGSVPILLIGSVIIKVRQSTIKAFLAVIAIVIWLFEGILVHQMFMGI